ncbi:putative Glutamate--cysteine ligase catalytic subunit [Paratrimastix pyriformis]|uniref:Glutamate--cysteine ligase n=1 Tax=Paratrimastix pyriformis TaxID=342808 RepID=A0ABQ8U3N8_9EUKA|nr:putative Glutamate--cysteine ligase catalytic subunit [Paratrimastix pyriformis]
MGFLTTLGRPLHWREIEPQVARLKQEAADQFVRLYNLYAAEAKEQLLFGDECEYMLVEFNESGEVSLCLDAYEILEKLHADPSTSIADWSPEYARYMLEGSPSTPYGSLADVILFERNMRLRREQLRAHLGPGRHLVSLAVYPRLGRPPHPLCRSPVTLEVPQPPGTPIPDESWNVAALTPAQRALAQANPASRSYFASDDLIYPHPRFGALTRNIRLRRGRKVAVNTPLYMDTNTNPSAILQEERELPGVLPGTSRWTPRSSAWAAVGCSAPCSANLEEARFLYDQLIVLAAPWSLALTAASPYFRGCLADTDCRFNTIAQSVDDRTPAEEAVFPSSRYGPSPVYVSAEGSPFNDVQVPIDQNTVETCRRAGIDEPLARYVGSVLARDPLVIYEGLVNQDPATHTAHFQTILSASWTTVRMKVPARAGDSWRVEFRPMEMQTGVLFFGRPTHNISNPTLIKKSHPTTPWNPNHRLGWIRCGIDCNLTDFENAAFVAMVVLLSRAILSSRVNFCIPMSQTHINLQRAQARDALHTQKLVFRQYRCNYPDRKAAAAAAVPVPCCHSAVVDLTLDEIFNGAVRMYAVLRSAVLLCGCQYGSVCLARCPAATRLWSI